MKLRSLSLLNEVNAGEKIVFNRLQNGELFCYNGMYCVKVNSAHGLIYNYVNGHGILSKLGTLVIVRKVDLG